MDKIRYFRVRLDEVVEKLRRYFSSRSDVDLVILFGSILRRDVVRDVDVAVHFSRRKSLLEILQVGSELEELLGVPVDLVPIEEMPPRLRLKVLTEGRLVVVKKPSIYTELLKMTIGELEDLKLAYRDAAAGQGKRATPV